jgi:hypothetical protein
MDRVCEEAGSGFAPDAGKVEQPAGIAGPMAANHDAVSPGANKDHVGFTKEVEIDLAGRPDTHLVAQFLRRRADHLGGSSGVACAAFVDDGDLHG